MMKRAAAVVTALLLSASLAHAQTGTSKTQSQLNAEIGANFCAVPGCLLPDQNVGLITPFNVRQVLLDMVASAGGSQPLTITQVGPNSIAGPLIYDFLTITSLTNVTGPSTKDQYHLPLNQTSGLFVTMYGGGNFTGPQVAAVFNLRSTTAATSVAGQTVVQSNAYANAAFAGVLNAVNAGVNLDSGAVGGTFAIVEGLEADINVASGASVPYRAAISAGNAGTVQGSTLDAAYVVTSYVSGGEWQKLIAITKANWAALSAIPLSTTADLIWADAAYTVGNIFNLPTMACTGSILLFPNVNLTCAGALSLTDAGTNNILSLNQNTGALATTFPGATLQGADGQGGGWGTTTFGSIGINAFIRYDGTNAIKTALLSGDEIGRLSFSGYNGTALATGSRARFTCSAAENWTTSAEGTYCSVFTTTKTTISGPNETARFLGSGGLSVGNANITIDGGSGIIVGTGFQAGSSPGLTQTCTVNQAKTLIFTLGILTGGTCNS